MRPPVPHGVDLRGFRSCLASLQKKLDAELQSARGSLGASKLNLAAVTEQVRQLREQERQEASAAMEGLRERLDAGEHMQLLRHLLHVARRCGAHERELQLADSLVRDAVRECLERDRRLAVVQRMQEQELRAHAALATRRQQREADLLWLVRTRARGSSRVLDGAIE
jgi:hypothetical protein